MVYEYAFFLLAHLSEALADEDSVKPQPEQPPILHPHFLCLWRGHRRSTCIVWWELWLVAHRKGACVSGTAFLAFRCPCFGPLWTTQPISFPLKVIRKSWVFPPRSE